MKSDLQTAVNQCIEAVGYEFDTEVQKMLIRVRLGHTFFFSRFIYVLFQAAQFGKCFIADMKSDSYVNMCRLLRVLNAVRDPKVGIPLTITQYPFFTLLYVFLKLHF